MYYLIQRYKFESNSQQNRRKNQASSSCIIWYKDTNLFTTHLWKSRVAAELYYLIQRYKFESNSQPVGTQQNGNACCIIWYKDTNLKAIHNVVGLGGQAWHVVLSDTKIQIWKQFTTYKPQYQNFLKLYYLIQRYKFESNSQHFMPTFVEFVVVLSDTKIQIWKQFTTLGKQVTKFLLLYYLIQRYKFESNSQRHPVAFGNEPRCIIWYKDTNLKAIHNPFVLLVSPHHVVLSDTKIQIWKQFTTTPK